MTNMTMNKAIALINALNADVAYWQERAEQAEQRPVVTVPVSKIAMIKAVRDFAEDHGIRSMGLHGLSLKEAKDLVEYMIAECEK